MRVFADVYAISIYVKPVLTIGAQVACLVGSFVMYDELDFQTNVLVAAEAARREGFTQTYFALLKVAGLAKEKSQGASGDFGVDFPNCNRATADSG